MASNNQIINDFLDYINESVLINYNVLGSFPEEAITPEVESFIGKLHESIKKENNDQKVPAIGDKVVAMWAGSKHQYFTATITDFDSVKLKYTIDWDDGDPTGKVVSYQDLAKDIRPDPNSLAVGAKVLFAQGKYVGTDDVEGTGVSRSAGLRWHEGTITKVNKNTTSGTITYDGVHARGEDDGKWVTYKDYCETFEGQKADDLRVPPNMFDLMDPDELRNLNQSNVDIFISHMNDNPDLISKLREEIDPMYDIYYSKPGRGQKMEMKRSLNALCKAKVFIACITDEYCANDKCLNEFQYAKKTRNIPVIPLIFKPGQKKWISSVVGMLIAGQLYIDFGNENLFEPKLTELKSSLSQKIGSPDENIQGDAENDASEQSPSKPKLESASDPKIFLSYCWSNSMDFMKDKVVGSEYSDPRKIKAKIEDLTKMKVWLDIEQLSSTDDAGMFGQIAEGLNDAEIIVICISKEYVLSKNCQMEAQFALRTLHKPVVVVHVGEDNEEDIKAWKMHAIGMLTENDERYDAAKNAGEETFDDVTGKLGEHLLKKLKSEVVIKEEKEDEGEEEDVVDEASGSGSVGEEIPSKDPEAETTAPKIGDDVITHWNTTWQFFLSNIVDFSPEDMTYTVDWKDGDTTGRTMKYDMVAKDSTPNKQDIGIGSEILFEQGEYALDGVPGFRWHLGIVENIQEDENGRITYSGRHLKGEEDGKWVTFRDYEETFSDYPIERLRTFPTAFEALEAFQML